MKNTIVAALAALTLAGVAADARAWGAYYEDLDPVEPAHLVYGEVVDLPLDPANAAIRLSKKDPQPYGVAQVQFGKRYGELVGFGIVSTVPVELDAFVESPSAKGARPGWSRLSTMSSCRTAGGSRAPSQTCGNADGRPQFIPAYHTFPGSNQFRLEVRAVQPNVRGSVRVFLFLWPLKPGAPEEIWTPPYEDLYARWAAASGDVLTLAQARSDRRMKAGPPPVHVSPLDAAGEAWVRTAPEPLRPFYAALYADGEHNAVLNFEKLGLAAMESGEFGTAEWAFDEALARIETIYAKDAAATAARSKWANEAVKDFKGEPYERAMAYYYRGLLYLRAGDYDNARAAFASAEFQDTVSEAEEFQADFGLMNWLAGWSAQCAGQASLAGDSFAAAARIDAALARPASGSDTLYLAELGRGPVKIVRGGQRDLLYMALPANGGERETARVVSGGQRLELATAADVVWQGTTRGSRPIDAILAGKASFQRTTYGTADALSQAVASIPILALPALALAYTSGRTQTEADARMWDTLPGRIALATSARPDDAGVAFEYADVAGEPPRTQPWLQARAGSCGIVWSRAHSVLAAGAGVPGNDPKIVAERAKKKEPAQRDAAFRAALHGSESGGGR